MPILSFVKRKVSHIFRKKNTRGTDVDPGPRPASADSAASSWIHVSPYPSCDYSPRTQPSHVRALEPVSPVIGLNEDDDLLDPNKERQNSHGPSITSSPFSDSEEDLQAAESRDSVTQLPTEAVAWTLVNTVHEGEPHQALLLTESVWSLIEAVTSARLELQRTTAEINRTSQEILDLSISIRTLGNHTNADVPGSFPGADFENEKTRRTMLSRAIRRRIELGTASLAQLNVRRSLLTTELEGRERQIFDRLEGVLRSRNAQDPGNTNLS